MDDSIHDQPIPFQWPHPDCSRFKAVRSVFRKHPQEHSLGYRPQIKQNEYGTYKWISSEECLECICLFGIGLRSIGLQTVCTSVTIVSYP